MATGTLDYAPSNTPITVTQTSLASGAYRESTAVVNSTGYLDLLVSGIIQVGTLTADGTIDFYVAGSTDGTNFTAGLTGTDGAVTWGTTGNSGDDSYLDLKHLGSIATDGNDDNTDMRYGPFSVASAFGVVPPYVAIVIRNNSGATTHATGTNNLCQYLGVAVDNS